MVKFRIVFVTLLFFVIHTKFAEAKDIPVQGRFFAGTTGVDPKNVNETIEAQGLKKMDGATQLGLEITYPLLKYLDLGVRYTKRLVNSDEQPSDPATDYSANVNQDSVLLVARVPFVKSEFVRMDAFAGVGGSNTTFRIKTASQDGDLTRQEVAGWFATPYAAYGGSIAIGFKQVYLVFEGGFETNKVESFARSGSVSSNIDTLDFTGSYFTVGLMFDGIPGSIK